jgi:hypothetical protein
VDDGQSITLRCTLSTLGNPPITWSWVCGDYTLTTRLTNTGTQSVLTLTANKWYNQRTCHCRAKSGRSSLMYDKTSETQNVTVYCEWILNVLQIRRWCNIFNSIYKSDLRHDRLCNELFWL